MRRLILKLPALAAFAALLPASMLALLLAPAPAAAAPPAGLADPTRPPGAAQATGPAQRAAAPQAAAVDPPQLQSVQLGRGGETSALVDGRLLRVGDRLGEARVVAIDLQGLQLQGPRGAERLWLLDALTPASPQPHRPAPPTVAVAGDR